MNKTKRNAWHKHLGLEGGGEDVDAGIPGQSGGSVPPLPWGWVECNGQTLNDADSPLDGLAIPDLNGERMFLRGGETSGDPEEATAVLFDSNNNDFYPPWVAHSDGSVTFESLDDN